MSEFIVYVVLYGLCVFMVYGLFYLVKRALIMKTKEYKEIEERLCKEAISSGGSGGLWGYMPLVQRAAILEYYRKYE